MLTQTAIDGAATPGAPPGARPGPAGPARLRVLPGGAGAAPDGPWAAQFGAALARAGVAALPGALYLRQAELGLSAQEVWFISAALAQKWTRADPCPSLKGLAAASGVDAKWLKELRARLVAGGWLHVAPRFAANGAQLANRYDFGPLLARLEALLARTPAPPAAGPDPAPPAAEARDWSFAARYGAAIAGAGLIAAPTALFRYQRALGLSPQQVWFICYILAFQWGPALPYPSLKKMAARTGYSERHIHTLKESLVRAGYLRLAPRRLPGGGQDNNAYDWRPLFAALADQLARDPAAAGGTAPGAEPEADVAPTMRGVASEARRPDVGPAGHAAPARAGGAGAARATGGSAVPGGGRPAVPPGGVERAARGRGPSAAGWGVHGAAEEEASQPESAPSGDSNRRTAVEFTEPARREPPPCSAYIAGVILDYGREFGDAGHAASNVTRALRLWQASGLAEAEFVETLHAARGVVRVYQGRQGLGTISNRMAYFYHVVEDRLQRLGGATQALEGVTAPAAVAPEPDLRGACLT
jgi:hypothetical protein